MVGYEIDNVLALIRITCTGSVTSEEITGLVADVSAAADYNVAYCSIADCRGLAAEFSPAQLKKILEFVSQTRATEIVSRCGIVVDDRLRLVTATAFSIFSLASRSSSVDAKVFRSVREAEEWLGILGGEA